MSEVPIIFTRRAGITTNGYTQDVGIVPCIPKTLLPEKNKPYAYILVLRGSTTRSRGPRNVRTVMRRPVGGQGTAVRILPPKGMGIISKAAESAFASPPALTASPLGSAPFGASNCPCVARGVSIIDR